jgi:hypothetical protein
MKYYEVSFKESPPDQSRKLWKFRVELKNPRGDATDQSRAIAAATRAGDAALRTDFKLQMSEAKLVQVDPAGLDSGEFMTVDECRVWVLEKPNG